MKVLALDPADMCGWAIYDNGIIKSGVWELSPSKLKSFEGGGIRFSRLKDKLNSVLGEGNIERISYEAVRRHKGTAAAHVYGGYRATIMSWCEEQQPKIPYGVYSVQQIKKCATGKGNSSKDAVKEAAEERFNKNIERDDESDALWILVLMCKDMGLTI